MCWGRTHDLNEVDREALKIKKLATALAIK